MEEKMIQYWIEKGRLSVDTKHLYHKEALAKAMKSMPQHQRRFVAKWSCETLATGKNMTRWKQRFNSNCPFCEAKEEDTIHILCCNSAEAMKIWNEMMNTLMLKLYKLDTCWLAMLAIRTELKIWKQRQGTHSLRKYPSLRFKSMNINEF